MGFGLRAWGFGLRGLGFRDQVANLEVRSEVPGIKARVLLFLGFRDRGFGFRVWGWVRALGFRGGGGGGGGKRRDP